MKKEVSEAVENYLETILVLSGKKPDLHAVDICDEMGYSRPTVSVIVKQMKNNGLVTVDKSNHIALTEKGRVIAEGVYERHNIISEFFMAIGVDRETALADACKIEHDISDFTFECIKKHIEGLHNGKRS